MRLDDLYPGAPRLRERLPERFWSKVDVRGEDDCWPWLASIMKPTRRSPGGYGRFGIGGYRYTGANRIAYMLIHGEVPNDMAVCHSCDNPPCCNPAHLWTGTKAENNADRDLKGRRRHVPILGAANGNAKLTDEDVLAIRKRWRDGESSEVLAMEFGVSSSSVRRAAAGRSWKHVPALVQEVST